jgi:hypothetical protein
MASIDVPRFLRGGACWTDSTLEGADCATDDSDETDFLDLITAPARSTVFA